MKVIDMAEQDVLILNLDGAKVTMI